MKKEDFINNIVDLGFVWAETEHLVDDDKELKPGIAIRKADLKLFISNGCIHNYTWEQIHKQIGSYDVVHMTRIVGYYSKVNNWNPSKLGELKDRQQGNYR